MAEVLDTPLTTTEIDALGEIMNISMGSAATAISSMLDRPVLITTPTVEVQKFHDVSYVALEPAIMVKIQYVEGISGSNVMVFRQGDMEVIINLLMGIESGPTENFVFDEMSMSAACEIMNQMMGASATALSSFLGKSINISTPEAIVMDDVNTFESVVGLGAEQDIVSIVFGLNVGDNLMSEFISVMPCQLAREIIGQVMVEEQPQSNTPPAPQPQAQQPAAQPQQSAPAMPQAGYPPMGHMEQNPAAQQPPMPGYPPMGFDPAMQQQMPYPQAPYGQMPGMPPMYPPQPMYGPDGMPYYGYPPYGYPMQPEQMMQSGVIKQPETIKVQTPQFPSFAATPANTVPLTNSNMDLMMNVPLTVSVEIGQTKRKIKDIMDFGQGTVLELDKQAGAPVDIIVNGQLIARGDVIVVDDNFGVRITEILGTKELAQSLEQNN